MKKLIFLLSFNLLFAFNTILKIENLMGEDNYKKYEKLIYTIFPGMNYDIKTIISTLENNGLLPLFFNKAKVINTKFTFINSNPILAQKILNNSLTNLGYYYFYPINIEKSDNSYSVVLEMKSEHFIDPLSFINEISSRGCKVNDVSRDKEEFIYDIDCNNGFIKEVKELEDKNKKFINSKGIYWFKNSNFKKILIKTSALDFYHPSIWFYDENLNLLKVYRRNKVQRKILLKIPDSTKYIKITYMYTPENFKRGIIVKGLK